MERTWNHRVLAYKDTLSDKGTVFVICEVYYMDGKPKSYNDNAMCNGNSLEEITDSINLFAEALKKPILWAGELFPLEYND